MTDRALQLDYRQVFDDAPCGHVLVGGDGVILRANRWMTETLGYADAGLNGRRLHELFNVTGRILFETSLAPVLALEQAIHEVAIDLKRSDGVLLPVIMAANAAPGTPGQPALTRIVFIQGKERRRYEQELLIARKLAERDLRQEVAGGELREQFIAVLGHDLRNPLAAISAASRLLAREALSARGRQVVGLMQGSTLRMSALIDNVLDFARARLGGGMSLDRHAEQALEPLLSQVVEELRSASLDHAVMTDYRIATTVVCDATKIGQLASNLLGNAFAHGDRSRPILFSAATTESGTFRICVANGGMPIPAEVLPKLFDPFVRGQSPGYKQGLGLGLFIAQEIARAHGGTLTVSSSPEETRFTFEMPVG